MIDSITDLVVFARIVSCGSMTEAARNLDLSLAVVSKRLAALEERLGVRLLTRTTRKQTLTEEGQQFHARCVRILAEVQDAESALTQSRTEVAGRLRVTAPLAFGRAQVTGLVAAFRALHPAVRIELVLDDEMVDMVEAGIDVAIRFGALDDSSMIARHVAPNYRLVCAAPDYVARRGMPADPDDLRAHDCIVYSGRSTRHWLFQRDGAPFAAEINPAYTCNDGDAMQALALAGAGLIYRTIWDVGSALETGTLVRVLEHYSTPTEPLQVVYPHALHLAPRVRQFADFAIERLRAEWRW